MVEIKKASGNSIIYKINDRLCLEVVREGLDFKAYLLRKKRRYSKHNNHYVFVADLGDLDEFIDSLKEVVEDLVKRLG